MAEVYADWRGHVIVCGLRGVGLRIVEQLNLSGVPAVVLEDDPDPRLARILLAWGVPRVAGSSRAAESLTGAGLDGAAAVVCVQHDDLYTLETALLIRQLRPDVRIVVQFSNPAVGRALSQAGVIVLDVAALSAPSMVEACLRSGTEDFTLSGEPFAAARTAAPRAASLRELYGSLAPIAVTPSGVTPSGATPSGMTPSGVTPSGGAEVVVCPGRDFRVAAGDEVTLFGTPQELAAAGLLTGTGNGPGSGSGLARRPPPGGPGRCAAWCCPCCTPGTAASPWPSACCWPCWPPRPSGCGWPTARSAPCTCRSWTRPTSPWRRSPPSATATSPSAASPGG